MALIAIARLTQIGEESVIALVYSTILMIILEIIFFVQEKAQVELFLAGKVMKLQELQLLDMLDSVPDKVLVCSNEQDHDL